MHSSQLHYERLLAEHYTWMAGGFGEQVRRAETFFRERDVAPRSGGEALDLGCGPGGQAAALARLGFRVTAVDACQRLLTELSDRAGHLPVTPLLGDMIDAELYRRHGPFELVVCLGDTLTHLNSQDEVRRLFESVAEVLADDGKFMLTFRDLSDELAGVDRAIPVRLDDDRLMLTFLEYSAEHVNVHDQVLVRGEEGWQMHKSVYSKLRISTADVERLLSAAGFDAAGFDATAGNCDDRLVQLVAAKR